MTSFAGLDALQLDLYDSLESAVGVLDAELRVTWCNRAWRAFAAANGGPPDPYWSGAPGVLDVTPEVLRPFYRALFERARTSGRSVFHEYDCDSAAVERRFRMEVQPLERGFVTIHQLLAEAPRAGGAAPERRRYRRADGVIVMCSHCRATRRAAEATDGLEAWDWVPDFVAHPPVGVSHGLCPTCFAYHYPDQAAVILARRGHGRGGTRTPDGPRV